VSGNRRVHITKRAEVATSHRCFRADWDERQNAAVYGLEARPHGHNYLVEATVSGPLDPNTGMVTNLKDVKAALRGVLAAYDHRDLNADHPDFTDGLVPTTERVLAGIFDHLAAALAPGLDDGGRLERVRLLEGEDAAYEVHHPDSPLAPSPRKDAMLVTRRYRFSAAHRLHSPHLSEAENRETFRDCNNPNGHGHDYALEVTVKGEVDPATGLAANHAHLDKAVREGVVDRFDYRNLNDDVPEFAHAVTTSENIVKTVWDILEKRLGEGVLYRVRLAETRDNAFEYYG
jgi:6-pyruvoyltetrahydropterin/6-carboxytetrahydropterin synthase